MPFKVSFTNTLTGQSIDCQYVPVEIDETHEATNQRVAVVGLPHEILQYIGGKNFTSDPTFEFNRDCEVGISVLEQRRFLMSLLYPPRAAAGVATGSPPDVLFVWPKLFSVTCRLTKVVFKHTLFDATGAPRLFTAKVSLEERRDLRLASEDVQRDGTVRSS